MKTELSSSFSPKKAFLRFSSTPMISKGRPPSLTSVPTTSPSLAGEERVHDVDADDHHVAPVVVVVPR